MSPDPTPPPSPTPQNTGAPAPDSATAIRSASLLAADAIGELMGFWNFKPSMGRVWTVLYLSRAPLSADEISTRTGLSAGSVSMTLSDLMQWGVIKRAWNPKSRRRLYEAETDILAMITRVVRERELKVVTDAIARLTEAARILDEEGRSSVPGEMLESRFVLTRVQNLLDLARTGKNLLETFSRAGRFDLGAIRGALRRS